MKRFIVFLQFATIFFPCKSETIKSENNRKWLEIGKELFIVEPQAKYTWRHAEAECRKHHSNLLTLNKNDDYSKLRSAIVSNYENYSSFWSNTTPEEPTTFLDLIGLGRGRHNSDKCKKIDNSSKFQFLPENCNSELGFICHKSYLKDRTTFETESAEYFVQPDLGYICEQAYDLCEKRHMSLLVIKDYFNEKLLQNYILIKYGSSVSFWFRYNNETHSYCASPQRDQPIVYDSKLGFICQRPKIKLRALSMRHMILLIFVASASFLAIIVFLVVKWFFPKGVDCLDYPESNYMDDIKETDIN